MSDEEEYAEEFEGEDDEVDEPEPSQEDDDLPPVDDVEPPPPPQEEPDVDIEAPPINEDEPPEPNDDNARSVSNSDIEIPNYEAVDTGTYAQDEFQFQQPQAYNEGSEWAPLIAEEEWLIDDGWTLEENQEGPNAPVLEEEDYKDTDKHIKFILERRSFYDNQQPFFGNDDVEIEEQSDEDSILPEEVEPEPEIVTSEQEFINVHMTIPEAPAIERLDKECHTSTNQVFDPLVTYLEEKEPYTSTTEPRMYRCPSIDTFFRTQKGPTVQLYLYPGNKIISKECRLDTNIFQLKVAIGRYVRVPPTHLDIRKNRNLISEDKTLYDLGARPTKKIKFTVEINRRIPGTYELNLPRDRSVVEKIPDVSRKVRVRLDDGTTRIVQVNITFAQENKPMLGGFVDKRNNKVYHHAATGVEVDYKPYRPSQTNVAVQAYSTKVSQVQSLSNKGQQMEKRGFYVSEVNDYCKYPKPYTSFEMIQKKRHHSAIIIQTNWRRLMAIKERRRREEGLIKRVQWAERVRMGRLEQRKEIMSKEIERQENPKRPVDLELLYRAINVWRQEQEDWVNLNRWGAEKKAALAALTDIESDLLLDLERTKNRIEVQERGNKILREFERMGHPKRWLSEKTKNFIVADDNGKAHVRELQAIYIELQTPVARTPEGVRLRCALLSRLDHMTKVVHTNMSEMLRELLTRELSFLRSPKCSPVLLAGVRRRISSTFFFLCQDPIFNPEAKRVQKIPHDLTKLKKDMRQCHGCRRMMHVGQFTVIKGTTLTNRCLSCMNLYRTAIQRIDLNLYRHMLKELRRDELAAGVINSVTFLMDAFDLKFLVDEIWHAQSALSGIDNRYLLRLCRFRKETPWAPWNCVLLTDEEATAHLQLDNLKDAYKPTFFHKVLVKQCTAKQYFHGISRLRIGLDERVNENCKTAEARAKKMGEIKQKVLKRMKVLAMLS